MQNLVRSTPVQRISANRRVFLKASSLAVGAYLGTGLRTRETLAAESKSPNEQPVFGFIGTGIRYHTYHGRTALQHGPCAGLADCDSLQTGRAHQVAIDVHRGKNRPLNIRTYEDYRHLLDRDDVDAIVIGSVDHWHTKQVIDAFNAGKDVYAEKPLTLTIREGQQIVEAQKKTGRVIQVGTQQRTEFDKRFAQAAAMVRDNRVGDVKRVTVVVGGSRESDALPKVEPPKSLNWDMWQGQTPRVEYREAPEISDTSGWGAGHPFGRAHRYYRWFYEYSGGKLTDWGAHHIDVAMWALNKQGDDIGRVRIEPNQVVHPVEFDGKGMPMSDDRFNTATKFNVKCTFADGIEMMVRDNAKEMGFDNGVMFEGSTGRFLVNRGKIVGSPVKALAKNPLPNDAFSKLYKEPSTPSLEGYGEDGFHMKNFVECIKTRNTPASDLQSHNRMLNVCHAINVAMRLNRPVTYDPKTESFGDDPLANSFIEREQRKGYEISV